MTRLHTAIFGAGLALLGTMSPANANTILSFGDSHSLGFVVDGTPTDPAHEVQYLTHLIGMTPGTTDLNVVFSPDNMNITRTSNLFSPLDAPTAVGAVSGVSATGISLNGQLYLYAFYGAGNIFEKTTLGYAWYVGNLSGLVDIPTKAFSGSNLYNPPHRVPDGGDMVALLGLGLLGLAFVRRLVRR